MAIYEVRGNKNCSAVPSFTSKYNGHVKFSQPVGNCCGKHCIPLWVNEVFTVGSRNVNSNIKCFRPELQNFIYYKKFPSGCLPKSAITPTATQTACKFIDVILCAALRFYLHFLMWMDKQLKICFSFFRFLEKL